MKKKFILISAILCCLLVTGCFNITAKPKEIKEDGYSITLTDDFKKEDVDGFDNFYQNDEVAFTSLKEDFTTLESIPLGKDSTLSEYGNLVIKNNQITADLKQDTKNNYAYFTYEANVEGTDYFYYTVVKKGTSAFYLFNFFCLKSRKDAKLPEIEKWAASIQTD